MSRTILPNYRLYPLEPKGARQDLKALLREGPWEYEDSEYQDDYLDGVMEAIDLVLTSLLKSYEYQRGILADELQFVYGDYDKTGDCDSAAYYAGFIDVYVTAIKWMCPTALSPREYGQVRHVAPEGEKS